MGPSLDLGLRRHREASSDLSREAHRSVVPTKKKVRCGTLCAARWERSCTLAAGSRDEAALFFLTPLVGERAALCAR